MPIPAASRLTRLIGAALAIATLGAGTLVGTTPAAAAPKPEPIGRTATDPIAHDPTMIKAGDYYYAFITGDSGAPDTYLPMKRSRDLVTWEELGPVFSSPPQWIVDTLGVRPADFWAPDINYFNGRYHLYYSASQFGTSNSLIALATNTTLDPSAPGYEWVDQGLVLRSQPGDSFNAIDPDVSFDAAGNAWLAYGSFWSGILMRRLDESTGKLSTTDPTVHHLVDRRWAPNAVEGPAIVRHGDFYYLFASFDYCCRGENSEYRTVVGRSTSITGPYVDVSGLAMLSGGGTELLRSYNEFAGPGGGDIYVDGADTWFVHHYYDVDDNARPKLSVRLVEWVDGWPTLADPLSGSSQAGHGPAYFELIERTTGTVIGTVPGGPQAPQCGYEGADIVLMAPTGDACQQWRFEPSGDGYLGVRNRHSNKVFDAAFCGYDNGTNIGQWGWLDNDCQKFRFLAAGDGWTRLQNKNESGGPGKVVDAAAPCVDGANVQLWSPDDARCQQFRLQPVGEVMLVSARSGEVVQTAHCGTPGRSAVRTTSRPGTGCETWRFTHTSDGYYRIASTTGGKAMTVKDCDRAGAPAAVVAAGGGADDACAQWRIEGLNDGSYRIVNRPNDEVLGVPGCTPSTGPGLVRSAWSGTDCQRFRIVLP